jgi:hypothetical protein
MDNKRSPNYPSVSLHEAVELARLLWNKEKRAAMPQDVAARAWGYKGLNGLVRMKLSSLKKYGLLEGRGTDGVRLTDAAVQVVQYPPDAPEHQAVLQEAALRPDLFREVHESHADASDDNLRAYLITKKGFAEAGAKQFIRAFRDTMSIANIVSNGDNDHVSHHESTRTSPSVAVPRREEATAAHRSSGTTLNAEMGPISLMIRVSADRITPAHLDVIRRYLDVAQASLDLLPPSASTE